MKKLALLLILVCSISMSFAQVQRVKRAAAPKDSTIAAADQKNVQGESRKDMMKELNLTKEQKIKMKEMRQANKAALDAINSDDKLSQEEKKTRIKALRMEQLKNTMAILNEEQKAKLKQMRMQKKDGEMQEQ